MSQISDPVLRDEIAAYTAEMKRYENGEISEAAFLRFRAMHGTYTQRQPGFYMVRVKIPYGVMTAKQLRVFADVVDKYLDKKFCHITTRQAIQCYFLPTSKAAEFVADLAAVGLTSRESAGNNVRNVVGDETVGICRDEVFDYRPYAELLKNYFQRNPVSQDLPRKFKIGFASSERDRGLAYTNDLGFYAVEKNGTKGFKVLIGGGLGTKAYIGQVLHEFLPVEDLLDCTQAVITAFSRHGNRKNVFRARLKYLVEELGLENFQKLYETEFNQLKDDLERRANLPQPQFTTEDSELPEEKEWQPTAELTDWFTENVEPQKQTGYYAVEAQIPLGDLTPEGIRGIADLAEQFNLGLRTTIRQNLLLVNAVGKDLPEIHAKLKELGYAEVAANSIADLVSCPGTTTCKLALTSSKNLGVRLNEFFLKERPDLAKLKNIQLNISGCPNSCGQHRAADIGFQGAAKPAEAGVLPMYEIMLGARQSAENSKCGQPIVKVPVKNAPRALEALLDKFVSEQKTDEVFADWVERLGSEYFQKLLQPFTEFDSQISEEEYFQDFGATEKFEVKLGKGECAAAAMNLVEVGIVDAEGQMHSAEEKLSANDFDGVRKYLAQAGESLIRGLLFSIGVEFTDRDKSSIEFEQELLKSGKFSYEYGGYFEHAERAPDAELSKRLEILKAFVKDARFYFEAIQKKAESAEKQEKVEAGSVREQLDLAGVKCPINYIKVKLKLETLPSGAILEVLLDMGEPQTNVPLSVKADGHEILEENPEGDLWKIVIQKK